MNTINVAVVECKTNDRFNNSYYRILFDESEFDWSCLSIAIRQIVRGIEQVGNSHYDLLNPVFNYDITKAFCLMANNALGYEKFVVGKYPKCKNGYSSKVFLFVKSKIDFGLLLAFGHSIADIAKGKTEPNPENFHDYAIAIEYMWDKGLISGENLVPIVYELNTPYDNWPKALKYLTKDISILEFAYRSDNLNLLKKIVSSDTYSPLFIDYDVNITNVATKLFWHAENLEDYNIAVGFYQRHSEDIRKSITPNPKEMSYGNVDWDSISSDGMNFLHKWYEAALRQNNENLLSYFISECPQIFKELRFTNPYTGEYIGDRGNSIPPINMNESLKSFIETNIIPKIKGHELSNSGIWGYNAVTGAPIYEWQLKDIDSQRW